MSSKTVLLAMDIGNVCVRIDHLNCVRALGLDAIPPEYLQLLKDYECGRRTETEFFAAVAREAGGKYTLTELRAAFDSILIAPVPGMTELVSGFPQRGIHAVFFSDISPTHLRRTRELFPAAAAVPDGVYSFEAGGQKPSAAMLNAFETRFGRPDLYVDDREELILAARRHGWPAMQFTGAAELNAALEKLEKAQAED